MVDLCIDRTIKEIVQNYCINGSPLSRGSWHSHRKYQELADKRVVIRAKVRGTDFFFSTKRSRKGEKFLLLGRLQKKLTETLRNIINFHARSLFLVAYTYTLYHVSNYCWLSIFVMYDFSRFNRQTLQIYSTGAIEQKCYVKIDKRKVY